MTIQFDHHLFGLEARDLRVYEALLDSNEMSSIRVIADVVGINYGTTYEIIKQLLKLGLIGSQLKAKRRYYSAEPVEKLLEFATKRQALVARELEPFFEYVEQLKKRREISTFEQSTKFYYGDDQIAALLQDVLTTVTEIKDKQYQVISSVEVRKRLYTKFPHFTRKRVQLGLQVQILSLGKPGRKSKYADRRQLSVPPQDIPAAYMILFGEHVAQISLTPSGNIQAVVINDAAFASLQRLVFMNLWKRSWRIDNRLS